MNRSYAELIAEIKRADSAENKVTSLHATLDRVRALHTAQVIVQPPYTAPEGRAFCAADGEPYPCRTRREIYR